MIIYFACLCIIILLYFLIKKFFFEKTLYYKETKNSYFKVLKDKGLYGEYLTYRNLKSYEKDGARFLFNVYIPMKNGTTEIDVLMLTKYGIFVLESKNYSGWIFGNSHDKFWTQTLPTGRRESQKERFYNPILQNRTHIKNLQKLLPDTIKCFSIIVFSDRCTFKDLTVDSTNEVVIHRKEISKTIKSILGKTSENIDSKIKTDEIYSILKQYANATDEQKKKHIDDIQKRIGIDTDLINENVLTDSDNKSETTEIIPTSENDNLNAVISDEHILKVTPICPNCGKPLVLREAKRGERAGKSFYGCSGYPNCKYIKNLEQ